MPLCGALPSRAGLEPRSGEGPPGEALLRQRSPPLPLLGPERALRGVWGHMEASDV